MLLEIKTSEGSLDLPDDADRDFYITKQLRDVHELDTREGDYTKTLKLPYTPKNIRLIGEETPLLTRHKDVGTQFISVQVLMSGFPVLDSPIMRVESGDSQFFTVTLFGGVVGFFIQIPDSPISSLDWSSDNYNFVWSSANLQARKNTELADDTIIFPNCSWYTNRGINDVLSNSGNIDNAGLNDFQLAQSGFFVYVKTVMDKIFDRLNGLIVDYGDLDKEDRFNRLAFACKMPELRESYTLPSGGTFRGSSSASIPALTGQLSFKSAQIASQSNNITLVNSEWIIPTRGYQIIQVTIRGLSAGIPDATISVMRNEEVMQSYLFNQSGDFLISESFTFQAEQNDRIWYRIVTRGTAGVVMTSNFNSGLSVYRTGGTDQIVSMSNHLPDVTQRDFVKAIFNMFNVIVLQSEGQVTFKLWDNIPAADPIKIDVDLEKMPIESGIWSGYAARNRLIYAPNDLVLRQDADSFFDIRVAATDTEITKIELPFSTIDDTLSTAGNGQLIRSGVPTIDPAYSLETNAIAWVGSVFTTVDSHGLKLGDLILVGTLFTRVIAINGSKSGTAQIPLPNSPTWSRISFSDANSAPLHVALMNQTSGTFRILDGSTLSSEVGNFKTAVFDQSLIWDTLMDNYFKNLINAVSNPFRLVAWFDISILLYLSIDQTRPFYLPSYGALFYVNVIEQFKARGMVRIELLQIGSATNLVADPQGLQVGAFDDSFSNAFDNYDATEI